MSTTTISNSFVIVARNSSNRSEIKSSAGLRVGLLLTHPEIADIFRAVQLPYNVSALTHAVALKIAQDEAAIPRRVEQCARERAKVSAALSRVDSIDVHPSTTNFILFRLKDAKPADVHARFLEQGVLIRDVSMWPGCEGCLRVSIGTPAENDRFISAIAHAFPAPARA